MRLIADLHFHSRFSRACSPDLTIPNLEKIAAFKGVHLLGTGDFTHPAWFAEIKEMLEPAEEGLYKVKSLYSLIRSPSPNPSHQGRGNIEGEGLYRISPHLTSPTRGEEFKKSSSLPLVGPPAGEAGRAREGGVRFILTAEISSIYSQSGPSTSLRTNKTRRVHTVFAMPSIASVEKFNAALVKRGANLKSDGRPIVGISAKELAKIALDIEPRAMVIPAHVWTPWFAVFGSMSGFDSLEECFGEYAKNIFAVEMGMSSDSAMNWRVSALDRVALLASSDAHSLHRIGREGNVFELTSPQAISYDWVYNTIKEKNPKNFLYTIKYYPQEGRYHYDGHADCKFSCPPAKTKNLKGLCPVCGRKLTVGVLARVEELADREEGFKPANAIPTKHLVPLEEIIAAAFDKGVGTKTVQKEYEDLVTKAGGEFEVLLDLPTEELAKITQPIIAEGIRRVREEKLHIEPGYDGKYGVIKIFTEEERKEFAGKNQASLF